MNPLYYESHITIEPLHDGPDLTTFESICRAERFKPAKLFMIKERRATPERSNRDSFATGHGHTFEGLKERMDRLVSSLRAAGFAVWRAKIEAILHDEKFPHSTAA